MKTAHIIIAVLAAALIVAVIKLVSITVPEKPQPNAATEATTQNVNCVYHNIMTRTSVRAYSGQKISNAQIDTLMHSAMAAPTAMNKQPWRFIVITDRAKLDSIAANCKNIKMAAEAQLAIVVCGDMSKTIEGDGRDYWIQDCSAATENILLAAHSMGLGAVWCGIYPIKERVSYISGLLSLPESIIPLNVIPIGYPSAPTAPKYKYDESLIKRI